MRTLILTLFVLVLAVPALGGTRQPTLRVVDTTPLTVRGSAFGAREKVVVTVREEGRTVARRSLRSGTAGGFVAAFTAIAVHRCSWSDVIITARSARGAVAKAKLPQPLCPPAP